jgi:hypothetical protein
VIEALLKVWRTTGEQLVTLHRRVLRHVQTDETCRRLMTVPGVGAVTVSWRPWMILTASGARPVSAPTLA